MIYLFKKIIEVNSFVVIFDDRIKIAIDTFVVTKRDVNI